MLLDPLYTLTNTHNNVKNDHPHRHIHNIRSY